MRFPVAIRARGAHPNQSGLAAHWPVAEARRLPPLTPADLREAPLLAARLSPLLRQEADGWRALLLPEGIRDLAALRARWAELAESRVFDSGVPA